MSQYLLGIRNENIIFNTQQTKKCLLRAFHIISLIIKAQGHILLVNTNSEFFKICNNMSVLTLENKNTLSHWAKKNSFLSNTASKLKSSHLSYCTYKWVGGTLTNWKQISKSVATFAKFSQRCEPFLIKNGLEFPRYKKIKRCFQGLLHKDNKKVVLAFREKPDLVFLINPNENRNIINEANRLHIPVIALVESNTDLKGITYPIPVNTYSLKFIYYCLKKIVKISLVS